MYVMSLSYSLLLFLSPSLLFSSLPLPSLSLLSSPLLKLWVGWADSDAPKVVKRQAQRIRKFWILNVTVALPIGMIQAWASVLDLNLEPFGVSTMQVCVCVCACVCVHVYVCVCANCAVACAMLVRLVLLRSLCTVIKGLTVFYKLILPSSSLFFLGGIPRQLHDYLRLHRLCARRYVS